MGNKDSISVRKWVELCYKTVGKQVEFVNVNKDIEQRNYFSFYNYEYVLDVSKQYKLMQDVKSLEEGLKEAFEWYVDTIDSVNKKPYIEYINNNLARQN